MHNWKAILAATVLLTACGTGNAVPNSQHLHSIMVEVVRSRPQEQWLPIGGPISNADHNQLEIRVAARVERLVREAMNNYDSLPEVRQINAAFDGKFFSSAYDPQVGGTRIVIHNATVAPTPQGLEIALFGQPRPGDPITANLLSYKQDWRAVVIGGIPWTDKTWFDALLVHELYHALAHKSGKPGATSPQLSKSWTDEEMEAHFLESRVLNAGTGGKYWRALQEIVDSKVSAGAKDVASFGDKLSWSDLEKVDALFKAGGQRETGSRVAQYTLDLFRVYLEKTPGDDEAALSKIYSAMLTSQQK